MKNVNETDREETVSQRPKRSLRDVLTLVKNRHADRNDTIADERSAERSRLELLADELRPLVDAIDESDERFELALAQGETMRLWIDMTSFVAIARDGRTYRLLKDTRGGRIIMAESDDTGIMATTISEYIGERIIERERAMDGEWVSLKTQIARSETQRSAIALRKQNSSGAFLDEGIPEAEANKKRLITTALWFLFGASCALVVLAGVFAYRTPSAF